MATKTKEPLEVKIIEEKQPHPYEGQFPKWNEVENRPKKMYRFSNLQQPGSEMEATPGVTVIKNTGKLGTVHEKYKIQDGETVELPIDIVERWRKLEYFEDGRRRNRFSFEEV